jgi:hypothetical protein
VCVLVNAAGLRKGNQVDTHTVDGVHLFAKDHGPGVETKAVQGEYILTSPLYWPLSVVSDIIFMVELYAENSMGKFDIWHP